MANLKKIRINPETGEVSFFFPMELTKDTLHDFSGKIKYEGYEVGWAQLGNRSFLAVFIPVSESEYRSLIQDELQRQDNTKQAQRCIISNGHGGTKICPRQIPNPDYVEGGAEPKYLQNRCEDCPRFQSFNLEVGREALFSSLASVDEDGEDIDFDPVAPEDYYSGDWYEELRQEFLDYVRAKKPKYAPLADLLTQEWTQADSAKELNKADSTINSQVKVLRDLVTEFLETVDKLY